MNVFRVVRTRKECDTNQVFSFEPIYEWKVVRTFQILKCKSDDYYLSVSGKFKTWIMTDVNFDPFLVNDTKSSIQRFIALSYTFENKPFAFKSLKSCPSKMEEKLSCDQELFSH